MNDIFCFQNSGTNVTYAKKPISIANRFITIEELNAKKVECFIANYVHIEALSTILY